MSWYLSNSLVFHALFFAYDLMLVFGFFTCLVGEILHLFLTLDVLLLYFSTPIEYTLYVNTKKKQQKFNNIYIYIFFF